MIRGYKDSDYEQLKELHQHTEWYGGVFDEARDGRERLAKKIIQDPEAILVYETNGVLSGTISIIEDGRVAWLYRFIVKDFDLTITQELYNKALNTLKDRGHTQVLVYSEPNNTDLDNRYQTLGMAKGGDYTCYWKDI